MQCTVTFKEFYYLEEGVLGDSLLKTLKSVTDRKQINKIISYFKLDKDKVVKLLSYIKRFYAYLYNDIFENLRTPERLGYTAIGERKAPALAVVIAWLIIESVMLPLSVGVVTGLGDMAKNRQISSSAIEQLDSEVDQEVESAQPIQNTISAITPNTNLKPSTTLKKSKWSRYTDPSLFVTVIKAFESGDYNTPTQTAKPLKAYHDRTQRTIGFGTKANAGETEINSKEANKRLMNELSYNRKRVIEMLKEKGWKLNNIQINGLTDFAFNRGDSALRQMITKAKNIESLSKDILATTFITKPDGSKAYSKAIADRREWEVSLLMSK